MRHVVISKVLILSLSFLFISQPSYSEQYHYQIKREGREIRVNPYKGPIFNYNLDYSEKAPNLEVLSITSGKDLDEYFATAQDDLGLSKNSKLKEIRIEGSKNFLKILSLAKIPTLTKLSISCVRQIRGWNCLFAFPGLEYLKVECADNVNFKRLLKRVSICKNLKIFEICFDDYIEHASTRLSREQIALLYSLTHLKSLTIRYYRVLKSKTKQSDKIYYKNLAKALKKQLPDTKIEVELTETILGSQKKY